MQHRHCCRSSLWERIDANCCILLLSHPCAWSSSHTMISWSGMSTLFCNWIYIIFTYQERSSWHTYFLSSKYYLFLYNVATCSNHKGSLSVCVKVGGEHSEFLFCWNTWSLPYKLHLLQLCYCIKTYLTTALFIYNVKIFFHACVVVLLWSKVFHCIQLRKIFCNCKMIIQTIKFCLL